MKKLLKAVLAVLLCCALALGGAKAYILIKMPAYKNSVGNGYYAEKLKGTYLIKAASETGNNVFVFGSSELNTTMIASHPASFFSGERDGFQVNLIGRGSCQSIIHALNVGSNAKSLEGQKVVLISSPQSYIKTGIEPDMFAANFSEQQLLSILLDGKLDSGIKQRLAARVLNNLERYDSEIGYLSGYEASRILASLYADDGFLSKAALLALKPYYLLDSFILSLKDEYQSAKVIENAEAVEPEPEAIDWGSEYDSMAKLGAEESDNNDFGILNDYYLTNIGSRLPAMEGKDADVSYSESLEYDDLELLMDICAAYKLEVLYIDIPFNGQWSDYTGLTSERRQEFYGKVKSIVSRYDNVKLLDLTGKEYEKYYLCDVMHLGWMGWVEIDKAISEFYHSGN